MRRFLSAWLVISLFLAAVVCMIAPSARGYSDYSGPPQWRNPCLGDCNTDDQVTIDELVLGVQIAMGGASIDDCPAFAGSHSVNVASLVGAVTNAMHGPCNPPLGLGSDHQTGTYGRAGGATVDFLPGDH